LTVARPTVTPEVAALPNRLTAYLPGRITLVPSDEWPAALAGPFDRTGVRTTIPRYALELRTRRDEVEPDRVRQLADGSTIRTLETRLVAVCSHRGHLWVVGGHTALAAHLAAGTDEIPIRLVHPLDPPASPAG
jgi:hypothetical protein